MLQIRHVMLLCIEELPYVCVQNANINSQKEKKISEEKEEGCEEECTGLFLFLLLYSLSCFSSHYLRVRLIVDSHTGILYFHFLFSYIFK